jgi:hypothetical protein
MLHRASKLRPILSKDISKGTWNVGSTNRPAKGKVQPITVHEGLEGGIWA